MQVPTRIVNITDKALKGWLPVIDEDKNEFELFYGTAISPIKNTDRYLVKEGFHKNKSVRINYSAIRPRLFTRYIGKKQFTEKAIVIIELERSKIAYWDARAYHEFYIQAKNLEPGDYYIIFPDRKHSDRISKEYLDEASGGTRFAETWFPLVREKFEFQYLHYGRFSNGCATVIGNGKEWTGLYEYVITSRLADTTHGHLIVVDKIQNAPEVIKQEMLRRNSSHNG